MWLKWESCLIRLPLFIIGCERFSQYLSSVAVLSSWCASLNPAVIWGQQDRRVDKSSSFWSDESATTPLSHYAAAGPLCLFSYHHKMSQSEPTPTSARIRRRGLEQFMNAPYFLSFFFFLNLGMHLEVTVVWPFVMFVALLNGGFSVNREKVFSENTLILFTLLMRQHLHFLPEAGFQIKATQDGF